MPHGGDEDASTGDEHGHQPHVARIELFGQVVDAPVGLIDAPVGLVNALVYLSDVLTDVLAQGLNILAQET